MFFVLIEELLYKLVCCIYIFVVNFLRNLYPSITKYQAIKKNILKLKEFIGQNMFYFFVLHKVKLTGIFMSYLVSIPNFFVF
jgi:hypothetical protein